VFNARLPLMNQRFKGEVVNRIQKIDPWSLSKAASRSSLAALMGLPADGWN